jgi:siroheme synthase-like protein
MQGPTQVRSAIEPFVEPLGSARSHPGWTWAAEAVLAFAVVGLWADLARLDWIAGLPGPFDTGVQWWAYTLTLLAGLVIGRVWSRSRSTPKTPEAEAALPRLPVFLGFEGRRVVLVGAGRVGASKIPALLAAGADVTVIAPEISPLVDRSRVRILERPFVPSDLDEAWFVTAAAPPGVNRAVHRAAEERHIFVNAVDDPRHATAYLGGTIARGGVTIAVSTSGQAPALAGLLREAIDEMLPSELDTWVERAGELSRQQRATGVPMERRRPQLLETLNGLYESRSKEQVESRR